MSICKRVRGHVSVACALALAAILGASGASAYTFSSTLKDARQTAIATAIDAGGGAGKIEFGTAGMASTLCTITLNSSPAGVTSSGVLTLSGFPKTASCTGSGTIAAARIRTSANVDVVTGITVTATGGGGNMTVDNPAVVSGQNFVVNHVTFTHP